MDKFGQDALELELVPAEEEEEKENSEARQQSQVSKQNIS